MGGLAIRGRVLGRASPFDLPIAGLAAVLWVAPVFSDFGDAITPLNSAPRWTLLALFVLAASRLDYTRGQATRLHFHQLVMRGLEVTVLGRERREIANPLATVVITPLAIAPMVLGTVSYNSHLASVIFTVFSSVCFVSAYLLGIKWARIARRRM